MVPWAELIESVFLPLGISLVAACVFLLFWLARDRPGAVKGHSKQFFTGSRHPLTWIQKISVGIGFQVGFMVVFYLFCVDFDRQALHAFVAVFLYSLALTIVIAGIIAAVVAFFFKHDLLLFFVIFGLCSFFVAGSLGTMLYETYVSTERLAAEGKHFVGVSPFSHASGFRDAGTVEFSPKAIVDQSKAAGYKSQSFYCVAPIVTDTVSDAAIQFWAVGLDCCRSRASFSCGAYQTTPLYGTIIPSPVVPLTVEWSWDSEYEQYHRAVRMISADFATNAEPILVKLREPRNAALTLFNMSCGTKNLGLHVGKMKQEELRMGNDDWKQFLPVRGEGDWYYIMAYHVNAYWYLSAQGTDGTLFLTSKEHEVGPLAGFQRWTISTEGVIKTLKATTKGSYLDCAGEISDLPLNDNWTFKGWNFGQETSSGWGSSALIFFGSGTAIVWYILFSALYFVAVLSLLAIIPMSMGKYRDPDKYTPHSLRGPQDQL